MNESSFVPANDKTWSKFFGEVVKRAIAKLPTKLVRSAREITLTDMRAALEQLPEGWSYEVKGQPWAATLRGPTGEMGMYTYGAGKIAIQGFHEDVIVALGEFLAARCGPQVFSTELQQEDDVLFVATRASR